jgi:hypothetical protein
MNLGIIWKDGKIINHRSLVKVLLNPFLRIIGYEIATESYQIGKQTPELGKALIRACKHRLEFNFRYDTTGCGRELKRRLI